MKKKLGAFVLTLASLVLTAACASPGPSKPNPQPDPGETWAKAGPSVRPIRPANAAGVPTARVVSR
jgi:outer membrane biogenesis lipoprotein LolB